ncbi:MAG: M1 family aminopeptidase, partial [Myxococcota bacterium]
MDIGIFGFRLDMALVLLLSVLFWGCTEADRVLWSHGVSEQLAKARQAHITDVAYDLVIEVPLDLSDALKGSASIRFRAEEVAGPLVLDFAQKADKLLSLRKGEEDIPYTVEQGHIIIAQDYIAQGENVLQVEFIVGEEPLNRHEEYLYSLFVPAQAAQAFPCFDQPDLKAQFSLELHVPAHWEAVSNGRLTKTEVHGDRKICTFAPTLPISTYLFAFVAGEFSVIEEEYSGRKFRMYHRETDTLNLNRNQGELLRLHAEALDWLEEYTGVAMPFPDFKMVLIPSFQFGGMEHPGAIYYKASSLLLPPTASQQQQLRRANLIAHETAHLWFGDLVTMRWFNDVWLKE